MPVTGPLSHIDLSVGSVLGFTGMCIAFLQIEVLDDAAWAWPVSVLAGIAAGAAIGAWQGWWVAYRGVPAFVVTLGGLLVFRGAAYLVADGRTIAPLSSTFGLLGGGLDGSIGAAPSWGLGTRLRPPRNRPTGVRLAARMTGWDMVLCSNRFEAPSS